MARGEEIKSGKAPPLRRRINSKRSSKDFSLLLSDEKLYQKAFLLPQEAPLSSLERLQEIGLPPEEVLQAFQLGLIPKMQDGGFVWCKRKDHSLVPIEEDTREYPMPTRYRRLSGALVKEWLHQKSFSRHPGSGPARISPQSNIYQWWYKGIFVGSYANGEYVDAEGQTIPGPVPLENTPFPIINPFLKARLLSKSKAEESIIQSLKEILQNPFLLATNDWVSQEELSHESDDPKSFQTALQDLVKRDILKRKSNLFFPKRAENISYSLGKKSLAKWQKDSLPSGHLKESEKEALENLRFFWDNPKDLEKILKRYS